MAIKITQFIIQEFKTNDFFRYQSITIECEWPSIAAIITESDKNFNE
jgi:hypothetical protein